MKTQVLILLAFCFLFLTNCGDTNNSSSTGCGDVIIIDTNYDTTTGDGFNLMNVTIAGNCLTASIQYGGGCGEELVSFEFLGSTAAFPLTIPATLETKIILDDNDDCEALVTKEVDFDLTPLQDENLNNLNLTVEGWGETLEYSF